MFRYVLAILEASLGPDHPDTATRSLSEYSPSFDVSPC